MMKLDPHELRADAYAHQARLDGPLWSESKGERADSWLEQLAVGEPAHKNAPRPQPSARASVQDVPAQELRSKPEVPHRSEESFTEPGQRRVAGSDAMPGWLQETVEDPHFYDTPDPSRKGVCARVLPTTYLRLVTVQRWLRLRTKAATWEFLLRLGLAAG